MYLPIHTFAREEFYPVVDSMNSLCMAVSFPLLRAPPFLAPATMSPRFPPLSNNSPFCPPFDGNAFCFLRFPPPPPPLPGTGQTDLSHPAHGTPSPAKNNAFFKHRENGLFLTPLGFTKPSNVDYALNIVKKN